MFQWEAGLVRFLSRCALAADGLRKGILSDTGDDSIAVELLGDKLIRITMSTRIVSDVARMLGLVWVAVIMLSQTTSGFVGVGEEEAVVETSDLCQHILVLEREAEPSGGMGGRFLDLWTAARQLHESLESLATRFASSSYLDTIQLSGVIASLMSSAPVSKSADDSSASTLVQRCLEAVNGAKFLALEATATGLTRVLDLVLGAVGAQDARSDSLLSTKGGLEELLGSLRSAGTSPLSTDMLPTEVDEATSLLRPLYLRGCTPPLDHLISRHSTPSCYKYNHARSSVQSKVLLRRPYPHHSP